jgi:choline dehydrogenase-like flavoprotein
MDFMRHRSGIGARAFLEEHGIPVISDLPGVGQNYKGKSFYRMRTLEDPGV